MKNNDKGRAKLKTESPETFKIDELRPKAKSSDFSNRSGSQVKFKRLTKSTTEAMKRRINSLMGKNEHAEHRGTKNFGNDSHKKFSTKSC